jgi:hypothetical protein
MSADFKEETTQIIETREPLSEEEIIRSLIDEFNSMFNRESLEANPYLIFKMNSSLEIPVTAIYKDKRVSSICTNLAIIREALSNASSITYNKEKEIIIPKIKPMRNKIILNKIPDLERDKLFKVIYQAPEYIQKISDKYIENLRSYTLVLRNDQDAYSLVDKIKDSLHKDSQMEIHLEYEDLYLDLLQRAQDLMKTQTLNPEEQSNIPYDAFYQNYGYYYGMNPYMNPYMGMMGRGSYGYRGLNYNNQYYNNYYNQMFIRKAQDEANEAEQPRGDYYSHSGKKREKYSKKPYYQRNQRSDTKDNKQMSVEEIKRRTRVNSENFPPLVPDDKQQEEKEEENQNFTDLEKSSKNRLRYHKDDLIKIFKQVSANIKPNERLTKLLDKDVPVLNLEAKPTLEFIDSTGRK